MEREYLNLIGGQWTPASSGATNSDRNPARTDEVVAVFPSGGGEDAVRAAEAAAKAFPGWARTPMPKRSEILLKAAALLEQRLDEVAGALTREEGKTLAESKGETARGVSLLRYYAGEAMQPTGEVYGSAVPTTLLFAERVPLGPVALITPWNFPVAIPTWKVAPALAFGNTVVLKPAELTPLTALRLAEIYAEAGVPDGVFNVVHGDGAVGRMLTTHRRIAKVSLTGEVGTGRKVMEDAAATLKKVTMELGGKSPLIVFADADLENAVSAALLANFYTQGEICTNGTRVFVERKLLGAFLDRLVERTRLLRIGDPMRPETEIGALISAAHRDRVLSYIESGKQAGARLLFRYNQRQGR